MTCNQALPEGDGGTVNVWAPAVKTLALVIEGSDQTIPFLGKPGGWHELLTAQAKAGTLYRLQLPDGTLVPDPASSAPRERR